MPARPSPAATPGATPAVRDASAGRWLVLVHQLPASPSNLRVRTWRRLQQIGALPVKQAVYVLPDTAQAREDMEWLKSEITGSGGEATVFAADTLDSWSDDALVEAFRRARQEAYQSLAVEVETVLKRLSAPRRGRARRVPSASRQLGLFRERLSAIEHIDFFGSAGRDRVAALLGDLEAFTGGVRARDAASSSSLDASTFTKRLWVTRPRPGVDRMSSAWLIRRFIDAEAQFAFAPDRDHLPSADALPFDMFGVEFSHRGEHCTFETLCAIFAIQDAAVARLATIVHDLDLKDSRFGAPEAGPVGTIIDGLQLSSPDDAELLERGIVLFESLYLAFAQSARASGPRPVATRARRREHKRRPPRRGR